MVKLLTIPFSVSKISWFIYKSPCTKYSLNIMWYSDSPSKIDQLSLYNHGNPFSTSLVTACSLILPRVPNFKNILFQNVIVFENCNNKVWVFIEEELRWDSYMPHVVLAHSLQVNIENSDNRNIAKVGDMPRYASRREITYFRSHIHWQNSRATTCDAFSKQCLQYFWT
jgi:hypothetical protein